MPRAEDNQDDLEENMINSVEDYTVEEYHGVEQRYGLSEEERQVSGYKRICFCWGYTLSWCENRFLPYFMIFMYLIIFCIGYYSGYISNCLCDGSKFSD
tara:strand:- start:50 stop:346 length:297 start_codon:yes stop_codon:yes gene_type:complete